MIYGEHAYMGVRLHQGDRDWESGHGQRGGRGCLLHICCLLRTAAVAAVLHSKSAFLVRRASPCLPSDKNGPLLTACELKVGAAMACEEAKTGKSCP